MRDLAGVDIQEAGGSVVGRVTGEIDASNAIQVQRKLLEAVGNEGAGLVIDLTRTDYLDSAGIRVLFDTGDRLRVRGMELRIVAAPDSFIADVLATVKMNERYGVDGDTSAALATLADRMPRDRTHD
ncbi:MAG TPA: STAS domain-containing protein [Solirubrobacterales bacterium]|nr:STAS domain-containing protein [Solirubrobacterales bacterium]